MCLIVKSITKKNSPNFYIFVKHKIFHGGRKKILSTVLPKETLLYRLLRNYFYKLVEGPFDLPQITDGSFIR